MTIRFRCATCGEMHDGAPAWGFDAPIYFDALSEAERSTRARLGSDACSVDEDVFALGLLEIPIHDHNEPFTWLAWVSLSQVNFSTFLETFNDAHRSHFEPFFGWFSNRIPFYPDTLNLKVNLHLRDHGFRPFIEVEPTDHPLAVAQREGYSRAEAEYLMSALAHSGPSPA